MITLRKHSPFCFAHFPQPFVASCDFTMTRATLASGSACSDAIFLSWRFTKKHAFALSRFEYNGSIRCPFESESSTTSIQDSTEVTHALSIGRETIRMDWNQEEGAIALSQCLQDVDRGCRSADTALINERITSDRKIEPMHVLGAALTALDNCCIRLNRCRRLDEFEECYCVVRFKPLNPE